MRTPPLTFWEHILFFLGVPRMTNAQCFKCQRVGRVIDLGDSDFVCNDCWRAG